MKVGKKSEEKGRENREWKSKRGKDAGEKSKNLEREEIYVNRERKVRRGGGAKRGSGEVGSEMGIFWEKNIGKREKVMKVEMQNRVKK